MRHLAKKQAVNMLSGSIAKGLLSISLPIMITNVGQSLFNIVDMTILKTYSADGFAVGAVGACGMLISLITGLMVGISAGANVIIAKHIGSGDQKRISRAVGTAILFALLGGIALALIGVLCAETFLIWVNCPEQLLQKAVLYFQLYFAGMPILMLYNFSAAILRASGDTKRPMVYLTLGGVIKVTFNLLFVAGLHMTVDGVAYATLISWALSAGLAVAALFRTKTVIRLSPAQIRLHSQELKEMMIIGIPSGLQQALYSVANVIISATVNTFGPEATTGISIANNFDGALYQLCVATSLAVMPYVSQNIGARNISRATRSILIGVGITAVFGTTFGSLSALFSGQLSSIMSSDPAVIAYSQQKMVIISSTYFICGINEVLCAAMRGMGRPMIPTVSAMIFLCGIRFIWVYLIFPLMPNLTFLYLIWPIGWTLSIITLLFFLFPTIKKHRQEFQTA